MHACCVCFAFPLWSKHSAKEVDINTNTNKRSLTYINLQLVGFLAFCLLSHILVYILVSIIFFKSAVCINLASFHQLPAPMSLPPTEVTSTLCPHSELTKRGNQEEADLGSHQCLQHVVVATLPSRHAHLHRDHRKPEPHKGGHGNKHSIELQLLRKCRNLRCFRDGDAGRDQGQRGHLVRQACCWLTSEVY